MWEIFAYGKVKIKARAQGAGAANQRQRAIERGARGAGGVLRRRALAVHREGRRRGHRVVEALRRAGRALDVDVLALIASHPVRQRVQHRGAAAAAAADDDGDARRRRLEGGQHAAFEAGVGSHHRLVSCMGIRTPC
jgi:hypothetical protein